jgi:hypothetical protein
MIIPIKKILLENIQNNPHYIYHIGTKGYKDIRPLAFQKSNSDKIKELKKRMSPEYFETYKKEINAFLGEVTKKDLMLLKNAGFEQYQNINDLYLYKINLNDPQNRSKIESTDITSTPQQIEFQNKHWPKLYKKIKHLEDKEFFEEKQKYKDKLESYLKSKGIQKTKAIETFFSSPYIDDWSNVSKYFKKNVTCGNKRQYASCIPHIQVAVNNPLKFESVQKI